MNLNAPSLTEGPALGRFCIIIMQRNLNLHLTKYVNSQNISCTHPVLSLIKDLNTETKTEIVIIVPTLRVKNLIAI